MIPTKVSVIVPVYNNGKTIANCVESILSQSYSNIECIIVNDGSTDDTDLVCQSLLRRFDKVKYIKTQNCGASHARNTGMDLALGEYFIFVDADDYLYDNSISLRVEKMNDDTLVIGGYCIDSIENSFVLDEKNTIDDVDVFLFDLIFPQRYGYQGYIWNKAFSAKTIRDNNIRFNESIFYNEDRLFVFEYALKCKNICYIHSCLYCYVQTDYSAMSSVRRNVYNHKQITELTAFMTMFSKTSSVKLRSHICFSCFQNCINLLDRIPIDGGWNDDIKEVLRIRGRCFRYYCFFVWSRRSIRLKYKMFRIMRDS